MRRHPRGVDEAHRVPQERARARLQAYVYGNILVLASVVAATPEYVENGNAALVVIATTVTTYLAHVLAFSVASNLDPQPETNLEELRDALPIISSGSLPTVLLVIAALTDSDTRVLQLAAAAVIVARLAGTGALVSRLSGRPVSRDSHLAGAVVAVIAAVITVLKVQFLH